MSIPDPGELTILVKNEISQIIENDLYTVLSVPRIIPRSIREEIAEIVLSDLVLDRPYEIKDTDRFIRRFGAFYPAYLHLKTSGIWKSTRELSEKSPYAGIPVVRKILEEIFDLLDEENPDFSRRPESKEFSNAIAEQFEKILEETRQLWGRDINDADSLQVMVQSRISDILADKKNHDFFAGYLKNTLARINKSLDEITKHADALETLSLLFPGWYWDLSLQDMQREYFANLEKYAKILEKNEELKRILDIIGRIELEYGSKRIAISPHGKSEIHSLTVSHDIQHMLPSEALKLRHPVLKLKFYSDMIEGKLLTYALQGKSWVGGPPGEKRKGPVVALVDTSGSMNGSPEHFAKALILAIAKRMLLEDREVKVILFSGRGQTNSIELTGKKNMAKEFLKFLGSSFGGGTDFNTALKSGLEALREPAFKGADILFITDGMAAISDKTYTAEWETVKKVQDARIFSMIVGNDNAGGLQSISDFIFFVQNSRQWTPEQGPARMIRFIASSPE
jgi:uncharacterized protein with von Willebrand factor type A (vWA) domain